MESRTLNYYGPGETQSKGKEFTLPFNRKLCSETSILCGGINRDTGEWFNRMEGLRVDGVDFYLFMDSGHFIPALLDG